MWLSTCFKPSYDEAAVTDMIRGMEERNIPLSVFHFDCYWLRPLHWCDFEWDDQQFPDVRGMLKRYHIIQNLDADMGNPDTRLMIYPSVILALDAAELNAVYEETKNKLKTYVSGGETDDAADEEDSDEAAAD